MRKETYVENCKPTVKNTVVIQESTSHRHSRTFSFLSLIKQNDI